MINNYSELIASNFYTLYYNDNINAALLYTSVLHLCAIQGE